METGEVGVTISVDKDYSVSTLPIRNGNSKPVLTRSILIAPLS